MKSAEAMVVLLSPEAIESRWVSHEIEYALGAKRLQDRLIPVLVRPTKKIPWILRELQLIIQRKPLKKFSSGFNMLSMALKRPNKRPKKAFLSHSSKNLAFSSRLAKNLAQYNVKTFYSQKHIVGAQEWHDEIGAALKSCDWLTNGVRLELNLPKRFLIS